MIGELCAVACRDPEVLARLGGRLGETARAAATELAELASDERRALRAKLLASVRAPVPPGIRGVHGSWIEAGLAGLPARAREALASGRTTDPVDVWLVRRACAGLPPLPAVDPTLHAPHSLDEAIRVRGDRLITWLGEVGVDQLAFAVRAAGRGALEAVARSLPRILEVAERIEHEPRAGALGSPRAAIARCRGLPPDGRGLVLVGARALAAHVDALARQQLAVRLPHDLGLAVRAELRAFARTPLADAPAWSALGA